MIGAHKAFIANGTGKSLLSCVRSQVALKLIRAGKVLSTKEPLAAKRTFSSVPT